jgi:hypothetical protein
MGGVLKDGTRAPKQTSVLMYYLPTLVCNKKGVWSGKANKASKAFPRRRFGLSSGNRGHQPHKSRALLSNYTLAQTRPITYSNQTVIYIFLIAPTHTTHIHLFSPQAHTQ